MDRYNGDDKMKTIEQINKEELEEFMNSSKEDLIEEIYRLKLCLIKRNFELLKLRREK